MLACDKLDPGTIGEDNLGDCILNLAKKIDGRWGVAGLYLFRETKRRELCKHDVPSK